MIYVVTNRKLIKHGDIYGIADAAVNAGAQAIIVREKDLSYDELIPMALKLSDITKGTNTKLIINSNLQAAKDCNAQGYHCSFKEFIEQKPDFKGTVGVSVHSLHEALEAQKQGADYLLAGHVFQTDCKKGLEPRGLDFVRAIAQSIKIPLIAIGGITLQNAKDVIKAGADGIAVMSSVMESQNPLEVITSLQQSIIKD